MFFLCGVFDTFNIPSRRKYMQKSCATYNPNIYSSKIEIQIVFVPLCQTSRFPPARSLLWQILSVSSLQYKLCPFWQLLWICISLHAVWLCNCVTVRLASCLTVEIFSAAYLQCGPTSGFSPQQFLELGLLSVIMASSYWGWAKRTREGGWWGE